MKWLIICDLLPRQGHKTYERVSCFLWNYTPWGRSAMWNEDTQAVCEEAYMGLLISPIKSHTILPTMRGCHLDQSPVSNQAFRWYSCSQYYICNLMGDCEIGPPSKDSELIDSYFFFPYCCFKPLIFGILLLSNGSLIMVISHILHFFNTFIYLAMPGLCCYMDFSLAVVWLLPASRPQIH